MTSIYFRERGSGVPVILLHGFPLNHELWDDFAAELAKDFRIITPDLPGFGRSVFDGTTLTISTVADQLLRWIEQQGWNNVILIGHSLGGYVALAMADKQPQRFAALGLFHSTALADSPEKKESRNKVLEFIDRNGVDKFTGNFIGPLFADPQNPKVAYIQAIGLKAKTEPVKQYTMAMRDRPEMTKVLRQFSRPILIITGEKDGGITVKSIEEQSRLNERIELHVLKNTAHMGMIESRDQTVLILRRFINEVGVTSH